MALFGPGGFRGAINRDITPETALQLGRSLGRLYKGTIAVADDARDSAPAFKAAILAGITASGCAAVDLGTLPTPALHHHVASHPRITAGVMLTASHNAQDYNGIKLILQGGRDASPEDEAILFDYFRRELPEESWSTVGEIRSEYGAADDYVDAVISAVDADAVRKAGLTACIDCINGAAAVTTPRILAELGVRTVSLGCDIGSVRHDSGGSSDLSAVVPAVGADLGVLHDADGSRAIFVDSDGVCIAGDEIGALVARTMISEGSEVVTPFTSSRTLEETVSSLGGTVAYTPVGTRAVLRRMMDDDAALGVEEDGGLIVPSFQMCRDGGMALAKVLEIIAKGGSLKEQVSALPRYTKVKLVLDCPSEEKMAVMDLIRFRLGSTGTAFDDSDGLRMQYPDGWALVRASSTEDAIRVFSESGDASVAESRAKELYGMAAEAVAETEKKAAEI